MDVGKGLCLFEHTKRNAFGSVFSPRTAGGGDILDLTDIGKPLGELSSDEDGEEAAAPGSDMEVDTANVPPAAAPSPAAAPAARRKPTVRSFQPALAAEEDSDDEDVDEDTVLQRTMRKVFERKDEQLDEQFYVDPESGERSKYTKRMYKLVELLKTNTGLKMLKNSVRVNMRFKVKRYMKMRKTIEESRDIEKEKYDRMEAGIRINGNLEDESDSWHIFERVGSQLIEFERQIGSLIVVEDRARKLLNEDNLDTDGVGADNTSIRARRDNLLEALDRLAFYNQQTMILEAVSEIVYGFLINPAFVRRKFMNFLMAGPAGTGKTSIVREIASVFASAGIFVYNTVVEGGRNEFIAPYEGQTVGKTMSFLTSGLDSGVIFVDEAYSVTNWDKGLVSSYGAEATAAMVDFMTKYKGLYCLMFAGYEKEMRRYFLEANEGLPRRIPYQYRLKDYNPAQLVQIYKRTLLTEMGLPDKLLNDDAIAYIESAFTREAWVWLSKFVTYAREHQRWYYKKPQYDEKTKKSYEREIKIIPKRKYIWEIFKNQAGAMTNLAEATVVALVNTVDPLQLTLADNDDESSMQVDEGGGRPGDAARGARDRALLKAAQILKPTGPSSSTDTAGATGPADAADTTPEPTPEPTQKTRATKDLESTRNARFLFKRGNSVDVLRFLIKDRIVNTFMSEAPLFLAEFETVDRLANIATNAFFEVQLQRSQYTGEKYIDKTYYNADATIDVATEEVNDEPYQVLERPVLRKGKKNQGGLLGMIGLGGGAAGKPKVVPTKDMVQVKYCAGSYFHNYYLQYFKDKLDKRVGGWWVEKNHSNLLPRIYAAIRDVYTVWHHANRTEAMSMDERRELTGGDGKAAVPEKGFTLSDPVYYANTGFAFDTYLIYVDDNLDVELTLVYKKDRLGNTLAPKYQVRLINKAGFDPGATGPQVVYSVGVPFAAFRPETKDHLLTRILSIGENYNPNYEPMMKLIQKMVATALDEMAGSYILVLNGNGSAKYGMKIPTSRIQAPERGLARKVSFGDDEVPYAWVTEDGRQQSKETQNAVKGRLTPPKKAVATRSRGSVADADAEMPAADAPQDGKGPKTRARR
jgi:hypothetical protein